MTSPLTLIVLGQAYFLGSLPNTTTTQTNQLSIPDIDRRFQIRNETERADYTYTPGVGAHKIHTEVTTWAKALKICRDEGGHLAVINSRTEANVIAQIFAVAGPHNGSYSPNYAWIGTHDLISHQGDWETIYGKLLAQAGFNEWYEPKSVDGPHCGAAFRNGELSWFGCTRKLGFVCEISDEKSNTSLNSDPNSITQEASHWIRESLRKVLAQH